MTQPWSKSDRWFVASISNHQSANPSTSAADNNPLQKLQCIIKGQSAGFSCRGDIPVHAGSRPTTSGCAASLTSDSFITSARPHNHLQFASDLNAESIIDFGSQALQSTHRQIIHSVERVSVAAMNWVTSYWHTVHHESSKQSSDSRSNGLYRSKGHLKASREVQRLSEQAEIAEKQCDPTLSAEFFSQLVKLHPSAENFGRLSKQYTDMTYTRGMLMPRAQIAELNTKAIEVALKAVELDPNNAIGHVALCVSRGRLALVSENRAKIQLAKEAADDAATALRLEPHNDLAHHLMGRWHYEMAQINVVARTLIRIIFGTSLMNGTYQEALQFYRTAAELSPSRVIHRVEVGRTLLKLGDRCGAAEEFRRAVGMEVEDINAKLQQQDAADLLQKLGAADKRALYVGPADEAKS